MPCRFAGPLPTRRSRCRLLSSLPSFENCERGLPAVLHSAPPRKDIFALQPCALYPVSKRKRLCSLATPQLALCLSLSPCSEYDARVEDVVGRQNLYADARKCYP